MMRSWTAAFLIVLSLLLSLAAGPVVGRTWHVERDGSGDFSVIQQAVDAAASGDTILIGPGTYDETTVRHGIRAVVHISLPSLTLLGRGGREQVVIRCRSGEDAGKQTAPSRIPGSAAIVAVAPTDSLVIAGVSIISVQAGVWIGWDSGLRRCVIDDCYLRAIQTSLEALSSATDLRVADSEIEATAGYVGSAAVLSRAGSNSFTGCTFRHGHWGLVCRESEITTIDHCTFTDQDSALVGGGTVVECDFSGSGTAIVVGGRWLTLHRTTVAACRSAGILMSAAGGILSGEGNRLEGGQDATILIDGGAADGFYNNVIGHLSDRPAVRVLAAMETGQEDFDLRLNYWLTGGATPVDALIHDGRDDSSLRYRVLYDPVLGGEHFQPVGQGDGGAYFPMLISVFGDDLYERSLALGDEVGVFDGDRCLAVLRLTPDMISGADLSVSVNMDDPYTPDLDGFLMGDPISLKVWDADEQVEYVPVTRFTGEDHLPRPGTFQPLEHINALLSLEPAPFSLILRRGWNILSLPTDPWHADAERLLGPFLASVDVVFDQAGHSLYRDPETGEWINEIGQLHLGEGYLIHVSADLLLPLTGFKTTVAVRNTFQSGWNIAGYPALVSTIPDSTFVGALREAGTLIRVVDDQGRFYYWDSYGGHWVDQIRQIEPGEGYWTKVRYAMEYLFPPESDSMVAKRLFPLVQRGGGHGHLEFPGPWEPVWEGYPWQPHKFVILSPPDSYGAEPGDVLALLDGDLCVGCSLVTAGRRVGVVAAMDDPTTDIQDGFRAGDSPTLWLYRHASGETARLRIRVIPGPLGDAADFTPLQLTFLEATGEDLVTASPGGGLPPRFLARPYPNPFNPRVVIPFTVPARGHVSLRIYDLAGSCVARLVDADLPPGHYRSTWYGRDQRGRSLASGGYRVILEVKGKREGRSLTLIR